MDVYVIVSEKIWNRSLVKNLKSDGNIWVLINKKNDFTYSNMNKLKPKMIFIPHWSHYIPEEIYSNYECVVFHETDLPYGRGGSPIQNLIERGFKKTKVSAIKANKELDAGDVYLKRDLDLYGTAEEIYLRVNEIIEGMIKEIVKNKTEPSPQKGEPVVFKRRNPSQSNIAELDDLEKIYDYIRMLDAEGYPQAFIETKFFRFEFSRATMKANQTILADVRIIKK